MQNVRALQKALRSAEVDANQINSAYLDYAKVVSQTLGLPAICHNQSDIRDCIRDLQAENKVLRELLSPLKSARSKTTSPF